MEIGVFVYIDTKEKTAQKFEELRKNGFKGCQLCSWDPNVFTKENAVWLKELIKEYDIHPSALWCGWRGPRTWNFYEGPKTLGLVPEEYRDMRVEDLCRGSDFAKLIGVNDIITHMGFIPEDPNDEKFVPFCDAVRKVAQHAKKNGQYLLFETGQETPATMLRCFETVGLDNLGINLDTANLILYGKANPLDALDVFGKYVRNVHAKDGMYPVNGHDLGVEKPLGEGKVDFPAVIKKLHCLGYDGALTIEREVFGDQYSDDVLKARDYLESIIKTL